MMALHLHVAVDDKNDSDGEKRETLIAFMKTLREMVDIGTPYTVDLWTVDKHGRPAGKLE